MEGFGLNVDDLNEVFAGYRLGTNDYAGGNLECWARYFVELGLSYEDAEKYVNEIDDWRRLAEFRIDRDATVSWKLRGRGPIPDGFYQDPRDNFPSLFGSFVIPTPENVADYVSRRLVANKILPIPELTFEEILGSVMLQEHPAPKANDALTELSDDLLSDPSFKNFKAVDNQNDLVGIFESPEVEHEIKTCVDLIIEYIEINPDKFLTVCREIYAMTCFRNPLLLDNDDPQRRAFYIAIKNTLGRGHIIEVSSRISRFRLAALDRLKNYKISSSKIN